MSINISICMYRHVSKVAQHPIPSECWVALDRIAVEVVTVALLRIRSGGSDGVIFIHICIYMYT